MGGANYVADTGFQADGAIVQWRAVKAGAGDQTVAAQDTLGGACLGVAQNAVSSTEATAGKAVAVRYQGITRMTAGAALTVGTPVRSDASGKAVALAAATAKQEQVGIVWTHASADGDIILVLLTPGVQRTTA